MSGIAVVKSSGSQVKYSDKCRAEHIRLVGIGKCIVENAYDVRRSFSIHSNSSEQSTCDSHHQRSRHTLAGNVSDNEMQLIVFDKEVIQVATDLFGRNQACIKVDIISIRERREHFRDHTELDRASNAQFAFNTLFIGC